MLVVHNDDAPWGDGELLDGFEQGGEQLLTLVGHHDDSQLLDGLLRNMLFSHAFHSCTRPQPWMPFPSPTLWNAIRLVELDETPYENDVP